MTWRPGSRCTGPTGTLVHQGRPSGPCTVATLYRRFRGPVLCRQCSGRPQWAVATWTVLKEHTSVNWASDSRWRNQPRPELGGTLATILVPFRGRTLEDRRSTEPAALYTTEELCLLSLLCGILEICHANAERIARINQ
ncbi:hypothetical protein HPB47_020715 [Ixodes persulcatus]|uniref:Uncharacterized protein n=1 Tax=Ixodes persulcatus TaxID=34615 RepID=A0AC60QFG3_IXOPE|nr:hypothetical protein HPB47_020715 [Ixodes persulcatus]